MSDPILLCVAWPYANAEIHVGNMTGAYLPADILARYHRMRGRDVLMVSGTDSHGTPITLRADSEGRPPEEVYHYFHKNFLEMHQKIGITYDIFTTTHTTNHFKTSQNMFLALLNNKFLYVDRKNQWFSTRQNRFLPDRYVIGDCYVCGALNQRSDQCEKCQTMLDAELVLNPRSTIDGSTPELRPTDHFYLDLTALQPQIRAFLEDRQSYWRSNVVRQSLGQMTSEGLRGRAITRDLDWGIPVPVEGWGINKRLYVWFEAVIGYLSSTFEWSALRGTPDAWRSWWKNPDAKSYYFIGKDNIPFHSIIWPGELIGVGGEFDRLMGFPPGPPLTLPHDVPANEFLNLDGRKISGSKNWAIFVNDFLTRYDPDALRFYLTVNMPESRDADWSWEEFYKQNNDVLVSNWGNLANRVLSFTYNKFDGAVPDPGELTAIDRQLLATIETGFDSVASELDAVRLRAALGEVLRLATEVNRYLDQTAPWQAIKTDPQAAARSLYVALKAIDSLKILFAPFLPFSSDRLNGFFSYQGSLFGTSHTQVVKDDLGEHEVLLYEHGAATGKWQPSDLRPGQPLQPPSPLFKKLDVKIIEEERARLGKPPED
jgi:methionyl-tRNA synthetase